jgi:hypothetical protein
MFGVSGFGFGIILWQGFLRRLLLNRTISSILLSAIILSNIGGMIPMLDLLETRKAWWESNKSANWASISNNRLNQVQQTEIPADWGKGEWVDQCFKDLTGVDK